MAKNELSRRHFVAGSVAGVAIAGGLGKAVLAQESTPEPQSQSAAATPETATAGTPAANAIGSDRFPVRTELGPAIPPEYDTETNWPSENGDLSNTRLAKGSNISTETVGELGLVWAQPITISATYGALVSPPVVIDNLVIQQDAMSNVYAFDKESGELLWNNEYNEAVPSGGPNGVGAGYGMVVYTLGGPGIVIAAKADTGEEVWRTDVLGLRHEGITMAPMIYDSTVYVSTIPGTPEQFYQGNQRGLIIALDLADGGVLWYFDTTVDNLWGADGGNARVNSGGGLWHPPAIDENGKLYVGIGNASPYPGIPEYPAASSRPGDNDYANAIIRIDPDRAAVDWYLNVKPHDLFDLDNHLSPVLAEVDGRQVAITSGKHGYVVVVDRETGEELWRTAVGEHENDDLQELPEEEYVKVLPGTLGGVETPIAYADGVIFAPVYNMASYYNGGSLDPSSIDINAATGQLVALNAATGEIIWDVPQQKGTLAAATVVNDIVFTGTLDGIVRGYNVADGTEVFKFQTGAGLNAPFAVSGDFLFVPSGGPLLPSDETAATLPFEGANLIALKLGGEVQGELEAGASPESTEASPEAAASGDGSAISVSAVDINFDPKQLSIAADTDVTISVTNNGLLQHDFVIENTDFATSLLNGGDSEDLVVNLPAGEYIYFCSVPGHREAGMQGTLTVG